VALPIVGEVRSCYSNYKEEAMTEGIERIMAVERIAQLDVLRGIAILFILVLNIPYMADFVEPDYFPRRVSWTGLDQAAWWFNRLIDGTQRGLLELLFGAGVLIMARHAMAPDGPVVAADLHIRRNLWLAAFGIAHGVLLLWPGDILFSYGTAALLIFPFRILAARRLLIIGTAISAVLLIPNIQDYTERVALVEQVEVGAPQAIKEWEQALADVTTPNPKAFARTRAGLLDDLPTYIRGAQEAWVFVQFTGIGIYFENVVEAFATMLIGMALFKLGVIQGSASRRTYLWLLAAGYGIGLLLRVPATLAALRFDALPDVGMFTHHLARLPMTLGHVALVALLLGTVAGGRMLSVFKAPGRMPMTTYFSASIMAVLVFGGPFMGLWGRFGMAGLLGIALTTIALQLVVTNLWLRRFVTGPAEWLWKSLTYWKFQPWHRRDALAGRM
jgi:uncharacterized protein